MRLLSPGFGEGVVLGLARGCGGGGTVSCRNGVEELSAISGQRSADSYQRSAIGFGGTGWGDLRGGHREAGVEARR